MARRSKMLALVSRHYWYQSLVISQISVGFLFPLKGSSQIKMITSLLAVNQQIECIDTNNVDHVVDSVCLFTKAHPAGLIGERRKGFLRNFPAGIIAAKLTTNKVSIRKEKFNKEVVVISDAFK